jgi:vancomycin permeability regulator SanA
VILGAEVHGAAPSHMLAARLRAGIDLYRRGLVRSLLVTGANGAADREVDVMVRVLTAAGIPASAIRADAGGVNTAASCERAARLYGIRRAILVTQAFHAPRALYTCRAFGVGGSALGVPDWGHEGTSMMVRMTLREVLASVRAIVL